MKRNKLMVISIVMILALFGAVTLMLPVKTEPPAPAVPREKLVKQGAPSLGDPSAAVTIVEFLDPECESCAGFYPIVKGLLNDHKNNVYFVVRYMLFHGSSKEAALATEAAGKQGKYWEMQGQLFHRIQEWSHQDKAPVAFFEKVATELGLNLEQFRSDMKSPEIAARIESDFQEGPSLGVNGTPTIFVNGRILNELSYEALKKLIEEELEKKR